jgi:DNA-binding transcriptional ArsR family regulator
MTSATSLLAASDPSAPDGELDIDALLHSAGEASEFLKAMAHPTRMFILCALIKGERSVTDLEGMLDMRQPAVSQQLARLRADDLVSTRRDGKNIYYQLARPEVIAVIAALHEAFCARNENGD